MSMDVTAKAFAEFAGHGDRKATAVAACLSELSKAKARLAEAKAREVRKLLRATTMNGENQ